MNFGWLTPEEIQPDPDLDDIIAAQAEELADMPPDFDWDRMQKACELGFYRVWAAKDEGRIVAWICFNIGSPYHYSSTRFAFDGGHYCDYPYRPWLWFRLWRTGICALRDLGIHCIIAHANRRRPLDLAFKRLGFEPHGQMFKCRL